jgi:predicted RNA binding protein YcfA (HicA-like mRNA interferase family)
MLATPVQRTLRIPSFQATFNADGTILGTGAAALDTRVLIRNMSQQPRIVNISFWNDHKALVHDLNIALAGLQAQLISTASVLRGDDPRALPCPHSPNEPKHGPFGTLYLFQILCQLDSTPRQRNPFPIDNVIRNPIHGYITIDDLHHNGAEDNLGAEYFVGRPEALATNSNGVLVELTLPDSRQVVYSRPSWRGIGVVLKESQMKVREAVRLIESDRWYYVASKGSHRQYKHPHKPGRVTIPGKLSDDLAPGTFNSILKQAGLKG